MNYSRKEFSWEEVNMNSSEIFTEDMGRNIFVFTGEPTNTSMIRQSYPPDAKSVKQYRGHSIRMKRGNNYHFNGTL